MKRRNLMILGGSGGGTATIGNVKNSNNISPAIAFLNCIQQQLLTINCQVCSCCFIALNDTGKGFDTCNEAIDIATLYQVQHKQQPQHEQPHQFSNGLAKSNKTRPSNNADVNEEAAVLGIEFIAVFTGTVHKVNEYIQQRKIDEKLSSLISSSSFSNTTTTSNIDGLILVSCRVELFQQTLSAVASVQQQRSKHQYHVDTKSHQRALYPTIAVTGSGGTSLSKAVALDGIQLTGNAGGSVATTPYTKAISYTAAIANYYKISYRPWNLSQQTHLTKSNNGSAIPILSCSDTYAIFTSTINSSLPVFWTVLIIKSGLIWFMRNYFGSNPSAIAILGNQHFGSLEQKLQVIVFLLENYVVPISCCLCMVKTSRLSSTIEENFVSSTSLSFTAVTCTILIGRRSVLTSLLIGYILQSISICITCECILHNIPATMTNLLTILASTMSVCITIAPVSIVLNSCTNLLNCMVGTILASRIIYIRTLFAAVCGIISCYGSKVGWYHNGFCVAPKNPFLKTEFILVFGTVESDTSSNDFV
jgi:hypothetical protein